MKYLTSDFWDLFWKKDENKRDGRQFECLVNELLQAMYPNERWLPTSITHDGKKDFYFEGKRGTENEIIKKWAECKMYDSNVSIDVLSPTLIMSTLESINEVIFFSYSCLNKNAKKILSAFAREHEKVISIFDDEKLEKLILENRLKINFDIFFKKTPLFIGEADDLNDLFVQATIFVPRLNQEFSYQEISKKKLRVNEVIYLNVYMEDMNTIQREEHELLQVVVEYDLLRNDTIKYFEPGGASKKSHDSITIFLQAGEMKSLSLPFKITRFKNVVDLPEIIINFKEKSIPLNGTFKGEWLLDTPLIGYLPLLDKISHKLESASSSLTMVFGKSGVGKSRMMKEVQARLALQRKMCIFFSAEQFSKNSRMFWRKIISKLYSLPIVNTVNKLDARITSNSFDGIAMQILYTDSFSIDKNSIAVAKTIVNALAEKKCSLIIDNIHSLDNASLDILRNILMLASDYKYVNILLTFNEDLMPRQGPSYELYYSIKLFSRDFPEFVQILEITGFTSEQATMYVKHCLGFSTDALDARANSYDRSIKKIVNISQNNPFFLEQILLYLQEEGVLKQSGEFFYINNNQNLSTSLNNLPNSLNQYFEYRHSLIKSSPNAEAARRVLTVLCFFNELPYDLVEELNLSTDVLEYLCDLGFVYQDETVIFRHQLIARYCRKKIYALKVDILNDCRFMIERLNLENEYPAQYFISLAKYKKLSYEVVSRAVKNLLDDKIPQWIVRTYSDELFKQINRVDIQQKLNPGDVLRFYKKFCDVLTKTDSSQTSYEWYCYTYKKIDDLLSFFHQEGRRLFEFLHGYLNLLLTLHKNQELIDIGIKYQDEIERCHFRSDTEKTRAISMLLNRLHVAYGRIEEQKYKESVFLESNSIKCINESYNYSKAINDISLMIQNLIDYGNLYYLPPHGYLNKNALKQAVMYWYDAYELWRQNTTRVSGWEYGVRYHMALANAMQGNYTEALREIDLVGIYFRRNFCGAYFISKALMLKSIIYSLCWKDYRFDDILRSINEAEDICQLMEVSGNLFTCSFIRAKIYQHISNDPIAAGVFYEKALQQLIQKCENTWEEQKWGIVYEDIVFSLSSLEVPFSLHFLEKIDSPSLRHELASLVNDYRSNKDNYSNKYSSWSYFIDHERQICYPCP